MTRSESVSLDACDHCSRQRGARFRRARHVGLTLVEVLVAAAILSVAAIAALELLASTDLVAREARRQALASVEAERALTMVADEVRQTGRAGVTASMRQVFTPENGGESLAGCTLSIRVERANASFRTGDDRISGSASQASIMRLIAEVLDEHGRVLTTLERPAPFNPTVLTGAAGRSNASGISEESER
ncbi:MAG: hypothetical protein QM516_11830 [Limnohabitans sp.]|nr:hypothetical protein [Limnohabitans sp.]